MEGVLLIAPLDMKEFFMKKVVKVKAPKEVAEAYKMIKKKIDYPVLLQDKWAFEDFLQLKEKIDIMLTIESFSAPGYIKRDDSITLYVEEALLDQLKERAEELGVKRNTIMIQAIKNYCTYHGKEIGIKFDWSF